MYTVVFAHFEHVNGHPQAHGAGAGSVRALNTSP
jgi:hypothetical protein